MNYTGYLVSTPHGPHSECIDFCHLFYRFNLLIWFHDITIINCIIYIVSFTVVYSLVNECWLVIMICFHHDMVWYNMTKSNQNANVENNWFYLSNHRSNGRQFALYNYIMVCLISNKLRIYTGYMLTIPICVMCAHETSYNQSVHSDEIHLTEIRCGGLSHCHFTIF